MTRACCATCEWLEKPDFHNRMQAKRCLRNIRESPALQADMSVSINRRSRSAVMKIKFLRTKIQLCNEHCKQARAGMKNVLILSGKTRKDKFDLGTAQAEQKNK